MKKIIIVFFILLCSCSSNDTEKVDLQSFLNEGEIINLFPKKNLNNNDKNVINNLSINEFSTYNDWSQSNQNSRNLFSPIKTLIDKNKKTLSKKIQKFLNFKNQIVTIDSKSVITIYDLNLKKNFSYKLYKRKILSNYNLSFSIGIHKDKLFISDNLGNIHCLDLKNFELKWKKSYSVPFVSDIKFYKNNFFLINSNSKIYSFDTTEGKLNWSFETASKDFKDRHSYQIAISDNKLIFTNDSAEIFCLDLQTNQIKWSLTFQNNEYENLPKIFKSSPITIDNDGNLFISTNYGNAYRIEANSGKIIWSIPLIWLNRHLISSKYLITTHLDRFIILNKQNGKILFNKKIKNTQKDKNLNFKDLIVSIDNIYLFDESGFIVILPNKNLNKSSFVKISNSYEDLITFKKHVYINTNYSINKF